MHDRKILHRDLKTQNLFLMKSGMLKLGDFGVSYILQDTVTKANSVKGTPYYLAPELLQDQPYSFEADIWSLGIVLYELCCLEYPFLGNSLPRLANQIVKGQYDPLPEVYSDEMCVLVEALLLKDGKQRPNINQLLHFPLVNSRI